MDIRQMNYLITLERCLNFTRAAEELHIAQTTLSQQVSVLEGQLGFKLFERNNRSVRLTSSGDIFIAEAKLIVDRFERAVSKAKNFATGITGNITIGWWGTYEMACISRVIEKFNQIYPNVTFSFYRDDLDMLVKSLQSGRVDVLFSPICFIKDRDGFAHKHVHASELSLAVSGKHRFAGTEYVDSKDLKDEKFVIIDMNHTDGAFEKVLSQYSSMGIVPDVVAQPRFFQEVDMLVDINMGITVYPKYLERNANTSLNYVSVDGGNVLFETDAIWLDTNANQTLLDFVASIDLSDSKIA